MYRWHVRKPFKKSLLKRTDVLKTRNFLKKINLEHLWIPAPGLLIRNFKQYLRVCEFGNMDG